jgi:hypothetical protein
MLLELLTAVVDLFALAESDFGTDPPPDTWPPR